MPIRSFALVLILLVGCSRSLAPLGNQAVAIGIFEYQGDDAANLDFGAAVSSALVFHASAVPSLSPVLARDNQALRESGAARWVVGTVRHSGKTIRIHADLIDIRDGRPLRVADVDAPNDDQLLPATASLAQKLLDLKPQSLPGKTADWLSYAAAQRTANPDDALGLLRTAPDFYPAYPLAAELLLRARRLDEAKALNAPANLDPLSKAQLALLFAASPSERLSALNSLAALRPEDGKLFQSMAELAASIGDWPKAVQANQTLTKIFPADPRNYNSLAYAHAQTANLPAAVKALADYQRLSPNDPNVLDSFGEIHYLNRRFKEAAAYFDQLIQKHGTFMNNAALRKAAFAYFYAGDTATADARLNEWLKTPALSSVPSLQSFHRAMWLARTQRWPQAQALLEQEASSSTGARRSHALLHLALLRYGMDRTLPTPTTQAALRAETDPAVRNNLALFSLLTMPATNEAGWRERITRAIPPNNAALGAQLLAAALRIQSPVNPAKPPAMPLPNLGESPIDALMLKHSLAVLP